MTESAFVWDFAQSALKEIAQNPDATLNLLNMELSLPNIPFPTMGGHVFWNDIESYNGWAATAKYGYKACPNTAPRRR